MYKIELKGVDEAVMALGRMGALVKPSLLESLVAASEDSETILQTQIPTRTGSLEESITYDINATTLTSKVGPDDSYFDGRQVGRSTERGYPAGGGLPNPLDISARYGVSLGVGFAIAKKIQSTGTTGLKYVERSLSTVRQTFYSFGIRATEEVIRGYKR